MTHLVDVAVVGVSSVVGEVLLALLAERNFPIRRLYAVNTDHHADSETDSEEVEFKRKSIAVAGIADFDFSQVQLALFVAGSRIAATYVPKAVQAGCVVIDSSAHFRQEVDVPLVVPEVNAERLVDYRLRGIVAMPNSAVIQMAVALKPLYDVAGIRRISVCTQYAVSGAGRNAIEALARQTLDLLNFKPVKPAVFPHQIAFNVLPQVDVLLDNGYSKEEMQMVWEMRKMMGDEAIQVNATAVRVPVFYGHSQAIQVETKTPITATQALSLLRQAPGITVFESGTYPTAVTAASGKDSVMVGRVREDLSCLNGLNLWVVADNVRKGAALNSIQIAEILINKYL